MKRIDEKTKRQIEESDIFILFVMPKEEFSGSEQEEQFRYAMELDKHVLYCFLPGRELLPKPKIAEKYPNFSIVTGGVEEIANKIMELTGARRGVDLVSSALQTIKKDRSA